jgi:hypothetical protein
MPGYQGSQFALSFELTNVLPLKEIAVDIYDTVVDYIGAKKYRNDGSDILVEEELAAVFGRGWIQRDIENDWRKLLAKPGTFKPESPRLLFPLSRIEFRDDKTIVAQRAVMSKENKYLGTLVTLYALIFPRQA